MKYMGVLVICLLFITLTSGHETKDENQTKSPKLFFVSSSSTTSTLSTSTSCYSSVAAGAISQACARKRKSIITEEIFGIDDSIEAEATHEEIIASSMDDATAERQGKFLLYWLTTTSTSTLTSFTTTTTLLVSCIPSGINVCG